MEFKNQSTEWIAAIFDTEQPYLYLVVLPALIMFALGFRTQAMIFACGAIFLLTVINLA